VLPYKTRGIQLVALISAALVAVVAACGDTPTRQCRVGADCASGLCASDGTCGLATIPPDGSDDGGPTGDAMSTADGGGSETSTTDGAVTGCSPNKDGIITRDEVPIAAGLHATYKIGSNEDLPAGYVTGVVGAGGKRTWDFSAALNSDVGVLVETESLKGKYYETTYPNATYASKLSNSSDLLGVFETSPGALLLRGVVSPAMGGTNGSNGTQLTYTPGVSILAFPLILNATWTTDAAATGTAAGFPLAFATKTEEKYDSKVDAAGTLKTPLGTFDVLRVQVLLTRTVGTAPVTTVTTVRTFAFVTECYGTIATVISSDNEASVEFTHAVEIRRISP
jgi:hypothetical protein